MSIHAHRLSSIVYLHMRSIFFHLPAKCTRDVEKIKLYTHRHNSVRQSHTKYISFYELNETNQYNLSLTAQSLRYTFLLDKIRISFTPGFRYIIRRSRLPVQLPTIYATTNTCTHAHWCVSRAHRQLHFIIWNFSKSNLLWRCKENRLYGFACACLNAMLFVCIAMDGN